MIEIRRLEKDDDHEALFALSKAFFEEYEPYDEFFRIDRLGAEDVRAYFSRFVTREAHAAFLALVDGVAVGYITVCRLAQPGHWREKEVGHISGLMVDAAHRRSGIGSMLVAKARQHFERIGVRYFTVETAVQNRQGLEFYRRLGLRSLHVNLVGELGSGERGDDPSSGG